MALDRKKAPLSRLLWIIVVPSKLPVTLRFPDVLSVSFPERADRDAGSPLYLKSHSFQLTVRLEMTDASRINTGISGLSA